MPEAVIVATARSPIGRAGKGSLAAMRPEDRVFALPEVADVRTSAAVSVIDIARLPGGLGKGSTALYSIAWALRELGVLPIEALLAAATRQGSQYAEKNAEAIRAANG